MVPLSLIILEHVFGPGHSPIVHSVPQVECFTLHGKHLEDKKEILFLFFVAFLIFTVASLTVFFVDSKKGYFLQCN